MGEKVRPLLSISVSVGVKQCVLRLCIVRLVVLVVDGTKNIIVLFAFS